MVENLPMNDNLLINMPAPDTFGAMKISPATTNMISPRLLNNPPPALYPTMTVKYTKY